MRIRFIGFNLLCCFFLILFVRLGIWQIHRLAWKTSLITAVQHRIHQPPIAPPPKATWHNLNPEQIAYLPVKTQGNFLPDKIIYVTTVNKGQSGFWQMQVLQQDDNSLIFINRGFVPMDFKNSPKLRPAVVNKTLNLSGILRLNEVSHNFLYKNSNNKFYTRNIQDMALKLHLDLKMVAPYFIDEAFVNNQYPLGGLTKINFPNSHLSYAITWFVLAIGVVAAMIFLYIEEFL